MKRFQRLNKKEKVECIATIGLYPLIILFSQLGKVCKLFGTRKRQITASILCAAMILTMLPVMSLTAFDPTPIPLTFTAEADDSSVTLNYVSGTNVMYKLGDADWVACTNGKSIELNKNDTLSFKGTNVTTNFSNHFTMKGKIAASGDVTSLTDGIGGDVTLTDSCYSYMFDGCTSLTVAPELPATTLAGSCYLHMFYGCTSLTAVPELPATTLAGYCYSGMFDGCTSLTVALELPATTLADYCYFYMFSNCTSLTTAPALPATTLAHFCYSGMFDGCTSLTVVPELPATTLAGSCYSYMFFGCTSLTAAPELPATTLAVYCYSGMFYGCTSLTVAPALPATTLANSCYFGMFKYCTSLTTAPALPATTLANYCYDNMFDGCTSLTAMPELPAAILCTFCYFGMFNGCTSLKISDTKTDKYTKEWRISATVTVTSMVNNWNSSMLNETGGTFTGNPDFNTTYYIYEEPHYLTFTAEADDSSVTLNYASGTNVMYKLGDADWAIYTPGTVICLNQNDIVSFKGTNVTTNFSNHFTMKGKIAASGDVTSLTDGIGGDATLTDYCYSYMFYGCTSLTTAPALPAIKLSAYCYDSMFYGCTSLTTAPALSAPKLADYCYFSMFYDCTSLTTAPALSAPKLAKFCYSYMFYGCIGLTAAPALSAPKLVKSCYSYMFSGCTSLTVAPALPATTLADSCYFDMFSNCISLTTAPALPATTLADCCYSGMFYSCIGLTAAPALPATTLANSCYFGMFDYCTSLTTAPALPATILTAYCYNSMFCDCISLTTVPELPATTLADCCYYAMFNGCASLKISTTKVGEYTKEWCIPSEGIITATADTWNGNMFYRTRGTFTGNPQLNTIYYIYEDRTPPAVSGIEDGKAYCQTAEFTVPDNDLDTVMVNGEILTASSGKYTLTAYGKNIVVVTDLTGNSASITVTINASHTYDNACDTNCNVCNKTRTITHDYKTEWSADGTNHWHECSVCGEKKDVAAHMPETDDNDCTTAVHCTACNAVITAATKSHDFTGDYDGYNATHHWHICNHNGCDKFDIRKAHSGGTATYFNKAICTACRQEYGTTTPDVTAPTGEIKISSNSFKSFISSITFGLFFKERQMVTITGADTESGINKIYCYMSETSLEKTAVEALSADKWIEGSTLTLAPDWQGVVYAKISDKSGNTLYISSDGLVFDATSPVISGVINNGKYCNTATVLVTEENFDSVKLNGEAITLTDGKFTVFAKDGTQTIIVTDKVGNEATATITVYAEHIWDNGVITTEPTVTTKGVKTYTCTICGETKTEDIPMLAPSIIEGENASYTKGDKDGLTFKSNAAPADLVSVSVDGNIIDKSDYTTAEGSTIVTLTADYLTTLSVGRHTLAIQSTSGTAFAEFTIIVKAVTPQSPKTGDTRNMVVWIALMFVSGGALTTLGITKKRQKASIK